MSDAERGQLTLDSAEVYETFFVPALFGQFAPIVCDAAMIDEGQRVVDVACGTGVATRVAAERVGPTGHVVGVDLNDGMLGVARDRAPEIDWRRGSAEQLPLDDDSVDAAISQFGLMFFDDRAAALRELRRVVRPGGRIAVAVWSSLERTPGWQELCALIDELFGPDAAAAEAAPFVLGEERDFAAVLADGGLGEATIVERPGTAHFASLDAWITTEIRGWTLADVIDDEQFDRLLIAARTRLSRFVTADGSVELASPALIATVTV